MNEQLYVVQVNHSLYCKTQREGEPDKIILHSGGRGNGARGGLYGAKQVNRIIGRYPEGVAKAVPVVIGKYEQQEMADQEQLLWLQALEDAGVDNWSGIDHAHDTLEELKNG